VKPSHLVKVGDVINIKRNPVLYSYKILKLAENRMNAKLVSDFMADVTTPDQRELIELGKISKKMGRKPGSGRPTKKERRELDNFIEEPTFWDEEDWDEEENEEK